MNTIASSDGYPRCQWVINVDGVCPQIKSDELLLVNIANFCNNTIELQPSFVECIDPNLNDPYTEFEYHWGPLDALSDAGAEEPEKSFEFVIKWMIIPNAFKVIQ